MARKRTKRTSKQPATGEGLAEATPPPSSTHPQPGAPEPAVPRLSFAPLAISIGVAWIAFVVFVYGFASIGEAYVNGLDDRVGEVVAARADRLVKGYRFDEAVAAYREALAIGFQSEPDQRIYTLRSLFELLESRGRTDEAIEAAQQALALRNDYEPAYAALIRMLRETGRLTDALATANAFYETAAAANDTGRMARAKFDAGFVYENLGEPDIALKAYEASFKFFPAPQCALAIAQLHGAAGRKADARRHLEFALENGDDVERRRAKSIARSLGVKLASYAHASSE